MIKKYALYLIRWQLSTPILAASLVFFNFGVTGNTIMANFIGGLIFFWVDRFIFRHTDLFPIWQVEEEIACVDCGKMARGYRLVKAKGYDKTKDKNPEFRCEECSLRKSKSSKSL